MPPELPNYNPQPPQPNYDFIMSPQQPKRQFGGNFFDGSLKSLIIMAGAGIAILIIIFIAYEALKPASLVPQIGQLASTQAQMVHLSSLASNSDNGANSQTTKDLAANLGIVAQSEQNQLVSLLAKGGAKLPAQDLQVTTSSADQLLTQASQNSDFDSTFTQIATKYLKFYQSQIVSLFKASKSTPLKLQLQSDYKDAGLLLAQAGETSS